MRVLIGVVVLAGTFAGAAAALRFSDASYATPDGTVGTPYTHIFEGVGGCGPALPYRFTVINGDFPPGLSLAVDGRVSGTPTTPGVFSFWVDLSDENPPSRDWCRPGSSQREFTITVVAPPLVITTRRLPTAKVGRPFAAPLAVRGGVAPVRWRITAGRLPGGLVLAPRTGTIVGRPTQGGRFRVRVEATDRLGSTSTRAEALVVEQMTIATRRLPDGAVGRAYRARLSTRYGSAPVRWETTQGMLPSGLALGLRTGTVSGTPTVSGAFRVTVRARDRYGDVSTRRVLVVIRGHTPSA